MTDSVVSVVLATNRSSPYLDSAIQSMRRQTWETWELIVVDNGVPDIAALAASIAGDSRVVLTESRADGTVSAARNEGVARSSGVYLAFLDDDDVWDDRRLELQVAELDAVPSAVAAYSAYRHIDSAGHHFGADWTARPAHRDEILAGRAATPFAPSLLIRRSDFEAVGGYSSEMSMLEDFELVLRLLQRGDFVYVDHALMSYRRHASNTTSTAPANVRVRRSAMEGIVLRQRWAASVRGDAHIAALMRERLESFRHDEVVNAAVSMLRLLRRRNWRDALLDGRWGLSRHPALLVRTIASALMRAAAPGRTHSIPGRKTK